MSKGYEHYVSLAEHYIAIGDIHHYLFDIGDEPEQPKPWQYVDKAELTGIDAYAYSPSNVQMRFSATHPCGLVFEWNYAVFKDRYWTNQPLEIDLTSVMRVSANLYGVYWRSLQEQFAKVAELVKQEAEKLQETVDLNMESADLLLWFAR